MSVFDISQEDLDTYWDAESFGAEYDFHESFGGKGEDHPCWSGGHEWSDVWVESHNHDSTFDFYTVCEECRVLVGVKKVKADVL
jgi:hypothetical protein